MTIAYALRSGVIGFVSDMRDVPAGCIVFAVGEDVSDRVAVKARHARDGDYLLVPGVPEAQSDEEAVAAFYRWHDWAFPDELAAIVLDQEAGAQ